MALQCCGYMPPSAVVMALPQSPPAQCRLSVSRKEYSRLRRQLRHVSGVCEGCAKRRSISMGLECYRCMPPGAAVMALPQSPPAYCTARVSLQVAYMPQCICCGYTPPLHPKPPSAVRIALPKSLLHEHNTEGNVSSFKKCWFCSSFPC